jgi:hypothetical protein
MTRKSMIELPRFPLLGRWRIAIAQTLAPGWFHAREQCSIKEDNRRLLSSSDIPILALATSSDGMATHLVLIGRRIGKARPSRLHGFTAGAVVSLHTVQQTPGGGEVQVTSERQRHDVQTQAGAEKALMNHNFLTRLSLPADDARLAQREMALVPGQTHPMFTASEDAWTPLEDRHRRGATGLRAPHDREHWLALGTVDHVEVAAAGHDFEPDRLELVRLDPG